MTVRSTDGKAPRFYQYVQRYTTEANTAAAGLVAYWADLDDFVVTADITDALGTTTSPVVAGVFLGASPSAGKQMLGRARTLREHHIPCDVLHFDAGWQRPGHMCDLIWDETRFPDPPALLRALHEQGYHVCLWMNSYLDAGSERYHEAAAATPQSVWLGYRIERGAGDAAAAEEYARRLRMEFPTSAETAQLFEQELSAAIRSSTAMEGFDDDELEQAAWGSIVEAAEKHYAPCSFTSFVGWEWNATPEGKNLHRVFFMNKGREEARQFASRRWPSSGSKSCPRRLSKPSRTA